MILKRDRLCTHIPTSRRLLGSQMCRHGECVALLLIEESLAMVVDVFVWVLGNVLVVVEKNERSLLCFLSFGALGFNSKEPCRISLGGGGDTPFEQHIVDARGR